MRHRPSQVRPLALLALLAAIVTTPRTGHAAKDAVAVIPMHGDRNTTESSFATAVRSGLAAANLNVLSGPSARLLKRAHVRGQQLRRPRALRKFARLAKVGSVLLVRQQGTDRMSCILLDATRGEEVGQWQDLDANDAGADSVSQKVAAMLGGSPPSGGGDAAESAGSSSGRSRTGGVAAADAGGDDAATGDTGDTGRRKKKPTPTSSDEEAPPSEETSASTSDDPTDGDTDAGKGKGHGAWRPAFRLSAGVLGVQRTAAITPQGGVPAGSNAPPQYSGTPGHSNPFFPAFFAGLELFPLAFRGHGAAYEGIGVTSEVVLSQVSTNVGTGTDVVSFLSAGKVGATYRWVFGSTPLSPDLYISLGYSAFSFPLAAGQFPGISYSSFYFGANLHVPLFMEQLVAIGGINVKPGLSLGNGAIPALGTSGSGVGVDADLGLRLSIDRFELTLWGRLDFYSTSYKGTTTLPGSAPTQYNNVSLTDRLLQGLLTVGIVF